MIKKHVISFKYAFEGLSHAINTQPNILIHTLISFLVICLGIYVKLSVFEWAIISLVIGIGISIELINTAIESVVDLATDKWHKSAKIAKDTSAAAMLVYGIFSTIFACLLFIPKLINI